MREEQETVYYTEGGRRCGSKLEALESEAMDSCQEFYDAEPYERTPQLAQQVVAKVTLWMQAKTAKDDAF